MKNDEIELRYERNDLSLTLREEDERLIIRADIIGKAIYACYEFDYSEALIKDYEGNYSDDFGSRWPEEVIIEHERFSMVIPYITYKAIDNYYKRIKEDVAV